MNGGFEPSPYGAPAAALRRASDRATGTAMPVPDAPLLLAAALLVEAAAGYPDALYRRIGHPVTWIGALIAALDRTLNRPADPFAVRRAAGVAALLALVAVPVTAALAVERGLVALFGPVAALVPLAVVASSLLAQRSLHDHVAAVRDGLRAGGLPAGRRAVSMIVGRNPERLDEAGVCRAAVESLAENYSDGVVAPALWLGVGGLAGGVFYKAVNTADSMIGHRSERHRAFGWAAARLDDLVNLPASRLAALLVVLAALGPGTSARGALAAVHRDARHHRSPNAGWPEAAFAGALGFALAGPRVYGDTLVDDGYMGNGRRDLGADDVDRALVLYRRTLALQAAVALAVAAAVALV
ncbi:cobalamin biosynthesis protein CobD [Oharaeibacter diazotrophicus]|nr:cobalamin biosynthesis protein CobD [Oharaeibacter diazotrophicus]